MRPEPVSSIAAELGEGPLWDPDGQTLLWLDILGHRIHWRSHLSGSESSMAVPAAPGCMARLQDGGLLVALRDGLYRVASPGGALTQLLGSPWSEPDLRFNDGKVGPDGRFWLGSMEDAARASRGHLFRLASGGRLEAVLAGVAVSNGLGWSPDGTVFYYVDTRTGGIDAFDYDAEAGMIGRRRRLVDIEPRAGVPDGLAVDREGSIWLGLWGGGALRTYRPSGKLERVIPFPVPNVTSCAFGGPDLTTLYVTTAWSQMSTTERAALPDAGRLFVLEAPVPGLPIPPVGRAWVPS